MINCSRGYSVRNIAEEEIYPPHVCGAHETIVVHGLALASSLRIWFRICEFCSGSSCCIGRTVRLSFWHEVEGWRVYDVSFGVLYMRGFCDRVGQETGRVYE